MYISIHGKNKMNKNIRIITALCIVAFSIYIPVNLKGTQDAHMLSLLSGDENIQYPYLTHMLVGGNTLFETIKNFISYQHYFYGYPFYLVSAITIFPVRLIAGVAFSDQVQLNLLLLRQIISVIPMLLSIALLVYLQTEFKDLLKSSFLLFLLITIPAVTRNNIWFWHPDALALLGIVTAIYFLKKDNLQLEKNFYYAAIASGMAGAIKVIGVFFFLVILLYLVIGLKEKRGDLKILGKKAIFFLLIFLLVFLLVNPLLLIPQTRTQILKIQMQQNKYVREGWTDENVYQTGLKSWLPYFNQWYANGIILLFLLGSLIYGILRGTNRLVNSLLLAWLIPYSIYLLFFVAVKPFHYPLPVMIPLFSTALNLFQNEHISHSNISSGPLRIAAAGLLLFMMVNNSITSWRVYKEYYEKEYLLLACNSAAENEADGSTVNLSIDIWYRIEQYDLTVEPQTHFFSIGQGSAQISATEDRGIIAWACQDENAAYFSASRLAISFKKSHPTFTVLGPDGQEIK